jgi:Mitochondrial 39-S ribosomal protein L47 (MRP-L47)
MLLTEQQLSRRRGLIMPQPERLRKVRKSMGAIKHVLGERKRAHLARVAHARAHGGATKPRDDEAMIVDMDSQELIPMEDADAEDTDTEDLDEEDVDEEDLDKEDLDTSTDPKKTS